MEKVFSACLSGNGRTEWLGFPYSQTELYACLENLGLESFDYTHNPVTCLDIVADLKAFDTITEILAGNRSSMLEDYNRIAQCLICYKNELDDEEALEDMMGIISSMIM